MGRLSHQSVLLRIGCANYKGGATSVFSVDNPCNRSRETSTDASNLVMFSSGDEQWCRADSGKTFWTDENESGGQAR